MPIGRTVRLRTTLPAAESEAVGCDATWRRSKQTWLRRARGAIGMGLTWGVAWASVGSIPRWVLGVNADAPFPIILGVLGLLAGITVSAVLALSEGRRRFDQLSLPRFAAWGAVGGLALSGLFGWAASLGWADLMLVAPAFAAACAVCASGSLALARRSTSPALPTASADIQANELADRVRQRLSDGKN
jgi:hypothetical protein